MIKISKITTDILVISKNLPTVHDEFNNLLQEIFPCEEIIGEISERNLLKNGIKCRASIIPIKMKSLLFGLLFHSYQIMTSIKISRPLALKIGAKYREKYRLKKNQASAKDIEDLYSNINQFAELRHIFVITEVPTYEWYRDSVKKFQLFKYARNVFHLSIKSQKINDFVSSELIYAEYLTRNFLPVSEKRNICIIDQELDLIKLSALKIELQMQFSEKKYDSILVINNRSNSIESRWVFDEFLGVHVKHINNSKTLDSNELVFNGIFEDARIFINLDIFTIEALRKRCELLGIQYLDLLNEVETGVSYSANTKFSKLSIVRKLNELIHKGIAATPEVNRPIIKDNHQDIWRYEFKNLLAKINW